MTYLNSSTTIGAQETQQADSGAFLRIESEKPGDIPEEYEAELTQSELVDIFASIFGRGSCGATDATDAYTGPDVGELPEQSATDYLQQKYPGRDGAQQLAAEFGVGQACRPETLDGGEIDKNIYIHASSQHIFQTYEIVSYDAELNEPRYVDTDIYLKIEFSNVSSAPIYYYVDQDRLAEYLSFLYDRSDVYEWRGAIKDEAGNTVKNPIWTYKNGAVHFPGNWSGILIFKRLPIHYHVYTLTITGTVDAEATRHYDARVSGKAPGLSIVHEDISEEFTADDTEANCPWLDLEKFLDPKSGKYQVKCGNCGDGGGTGGNGELPDEPPKPPPECASPITAEQYNKECCGGPLQGCLPECREIETAVKGPVVARGGIHGGIVLLPEDGPCGTLTTTYASDGGNCCPIDAYVFIDRIDNQVQILRNGELYYDSGEIGYDPPDLGIIVHIVKGGYTIKLLNSYESPAHIKWKFEIDGEIIIETDFYEEDAPGGVVYSQDFSHCE